MKTDYLGIDYSLGRSNIDENGIRYGVIPANSVGESWFEESEPHYVASCPECGSELETFEEVTCICGYKIDPDSDFDLLEPLSLYIDNAEYLAEQSYDDPDIFILKSPYYTYCQFCSPCAPGAGYLLNTLDVPNEDNRAYCFGHDWFEPHAEGIEQCSYCEGQGTRLKFDIPNYTEKQFMANGGVVLSDSHVKCWSCNGKGVIPHMVSEAPYPIYGVDSDELIEPE